MFENLEHRDSRSSSIRANRSFFGNQPSAGFFSPPSNTVQLQQAPKPLPTFSVDHFVNGNFAFMNADYAVVGPKPKTGTLFISHGVHMNYPASMTKDERSTFEKDFKTSVHDHWSNKHMLSLDEPGFSPYQCNVDVTANVEDDPKNAHTVIDVSKPKKKDDKRIRSSVTSVGSKEGSKTTHTAKLDQRDPSFDEEKHLDQADFIRQVGDFGFDSSEINEDCEEDIQAILDFIDTIPAKDDGSAGGFSLQYVGRASSEGDKAYNKKLSQRRVDAVQQRFAGLPGLGLEMPEAAGEEEATEDSKFRRVNVGVFIDDDTKAKKTQQNVAAHEFGHMIGLGDEYVEREPGPNVRKKFFGDDPTHYNAVKEIVDEEAADELLIQDSTSIMAEGKDVKRGHYVMFVAAIDVMTRPEIEKATGKPDAKWKVE